MLHRIQPTQTSVTDLMTLHEPSSRVVLNHDQETEAMIIEAMEILNLEWIGN